MSNDDEANGEKVLVARQSAFQSLRLTEDSTGMRTLRFGAEGAAQSTVKIGDPRHLEMPYARLLPACFAFARNPQRILIVGLGGGTLPRFFHSHFPEMTIDIVELDQDVVDVARLHCGFTDDSRMRVWVEDGRDFIERSDGGYDVIILDSFDADTIPGHLTTEEFLGAVRKALGAEGIAIANIWGKAANPLYAHMVRTYRAAFEEVHILDVPAPGTKLFVALPFRRAAMTRGELMKKAREISQKYGFGYALEETIAGFRNAEDESIRGGSVLHD